uniref:Myb/SANT-like DNA-binding domain-containing protein n=1 Tax=Glossina brevipalpis TaxID=37001 RepID=A0A1A9WLA5_9MUSC
MKVGKFKRNFWLSSEIDCMLKIFKEIHSVQGSTTTTHYTFVQIANKMRKRGFVNKSPAQIRRKWFQMKSAYLCYKRGNVGRLLLIPERFRPIIATFIDNEYKSSLWLQQSESIENLEPEMQEEFDLGKTNLASVRNLQQQFLKDYEEMQKSLLQMQFKYQDIQDKNWVKFLSSIALNTENQCAVEDKVYDNL